MAEQVDTNEDSRFLYQEVCKGLHQIDDFRARLLALLPLSSGAGIFLLLETGDEKHFGLIGLIGATASVGLGVYEWRQAIICGHLLRVGAHLETAMGFREGQFLERPKPGGLGDPEERWRDRLLRPSTPMASAIVYGAVIGGWLLLAFS